MSNIYCLSFFGRNPSDSFAWCENFSDISGASEILSYFDNKAQVSSTENKVNSPFLYPLKTPENRKVLLCFQGLEKRCIGKKMG